MKLDDNNNNNSYPTQLFFDDNIEEDRPHIVSNNYNYNICYNNNTTITQQLIL